MKATLVMFLVLLSTLSFGQTLPVVVDNSKWFPPVRSQEAIRNCTQFALVYYLKSSIWNQKFNRDPKLEANQFNHNFVWNQLINSETYGASRDGAFYLMRDYGCATVSEFPVNEQDQSIQPSSEVKQKAVPYKSKKIVHGNFTDCAGNSNLINQRLAVLKDSLAKGKCFTLDVSIFHYFDKMTVKNNVYSAYQGIHWDSLYYRHTFTIVGYNDTIKTASGRGAFQVINSYLEPAGGYLYFDYNWFHFYNSAESYDYYFLEEDFSAYSQVVNTLPTFVQVPSSNLTVEKGNTASFTFKASDPENTPIVYSITSGVGGIIDRNTGQFSFPTNQAGNFSFTVQASDGFYSISKSFAVTVTEYVPPVDNPPVWIKTPTAQITVYQNQTFKFQFTASDPENKPLKFSTDPSGFDFLKFAINETTGEYTVLCSQNGLTVSTVKVTDGVNSISYKMEVKIESVSNIAPTFVTPPGTLTAYTNRTFTYQFDGNDKDNDPLIFSILNPLPEAQMSSSGKLTFKSSQVSTYRFTVVVSDGKASTTLAVAIKVDFDTDVETVTEPDYAVSIYPNPVRANTSVELIMKKNGLVNLTIYDLQGRQVEVITNAEYEAGKNTISYDASNLRSGTYVCRFIAPGFTKSIKIIKQ